MKQSFSPKRNISTHVTKFYTASTIGFGNFSHTDICDIISYQLIEDEIKCLNKLENGQKQDIPR